MSSIDRQTPRVENVAVADIPPLAGVGSAAGTSSHSPSEAEKKLRHKINAARLGFFTGGFTVACWAPIIPFVQHNLSLDPSTLGLLLLGLGIGSFVGMPIAGSLTARFGSRTALGLSGILSCFLLVMLAWMPSYAFESAALILYGIALGCLEVSVNIYGTRLQNAVGRPILSGLHACYSIGEVAAAGLLSLLLFMNLPILVSVGLLMFTLGAALLYALRHIDNDRVAEDKKHRHFTFFLPKGMLLVVSGICAAAFLAEGAMLDWGAMYLTQEGGTPLKAAGFGYTVFVMAMALSRLIGDSLVKRLGPAAVLYGGMSLNILSLLAMVLFPTPAILFVALFVMGFGVANIAPILITAASRLKGVDTTAAVTIVTTFGYGGLMLGPALLGYIADFWSLKASFLFIAMLLAAMGTIARLVVKHEHLHGES